MHRLRTFVLTLGLGLSLVANSVAAPPDPAKQTKATTAAAKKADMKAVTPPGPGYVWANKDSKIFHREGSRFYGKTKSGEFMKESDAVAQGYREAGKTGTEAKADKKPAAAAAAAGKKK